MNTPVLLFCITTTNWVVSQCSPSSMCTLIYIYTHTPVPLVYLPAPSHTWEDVRPIIRALLWARGRGQLHERSLINEKDRLIYWFLYLSASDIFPAQKTTHATHPSQQPLTLAWTHTHTLVHTHVHTHIHDHIYMSTPTHTQSIEQSGFAFSDKPTKSHMLPTAVTRLTNGAKSAQQPRQHNNSEEKKKKNLSPSANEGWQCAYKATKPAARWRSNWCAKDAAAFIADTVQISFLHLPQLPSLCFLRRLGNLLQSFFFRKTNMYI